MTVCMRGTHVHMSFSKGGMELTHLFGKVGNFYSCYLAYSPVEHEQIRKYTYDVDGLRVVYTTCVTLVSKGFQMQ